MSPTRTGLVLAAIALTATACGGGSSGGQAAVTPGNGGAGASSPAGAGSTTIGGLQANIQGQADVTGKSSVTVQASSYYFQPSVLKGSPGQSISLHVVNTGSTEHNITLDSQHINSDLDSHGAVDVKVTFPSSGVLSFWCEYHKSLGMVGGLLVSGSVAGGAPAPASSSSSGGGYGGYYGGTGGGG